MNDPTSASSASRVILVSNRLPATFHLEGREIKVTPSAGGLATGLKSPHERSGGLWIGWPGDVTGLRAEEKAQLDEQLAALRLLPVYLSKTEVERFYHGYCNGILWPLFHYLPDRMPLEPPSWEEYELMNCRFADAVAAQYREGDMIWVHDYHLFLVPELLRQRIPEARIGFFLHIPFPSSEIFRILPRRAELLRGMLGADLIGFHTLSYLRHFSMSLLRILGIEAQIDRVWHDDREVRLGVYPMGIDAQAFQSFCADPEIRKEVKSLREQSGGAKILLGVDRLDYTKGIVRRLMAFERLLEKEPSLREQVRLIQVATPSRTEVKAYQSFKSQLDGLVGRINGKYGTAHHVPIHYINRSLTQKELAALYSAADVMVVTPLRDGLNLVAKEYVACRSDLDGVLVLSELAGVASELTEALLVNPYDLDGVADAFVRALRMDPGERTTRLEAMRQRVSSYDVHRWASSFLEDLAAVSSESSRTGVRSSSQRTLKECMDRILAASRVILFLDYDGTLVPHVEHPDLAVPDPDLLGLLGGLALRPETCVHMVSGRERASLERWLGHLPLHLHAEHGLWSRDPATREWVANFQPSEEWKQKVRPILEGFTKSSPGSFIEEKHSGLTWHYRRVDPVIGAAQAKELRLFLFEILSNLPVEVIAGEKVVEIRAQGANKGSIVTRVLGAETKPALPVAMGNDRTDEDLFTSLPPGSISIHIGPACTKATYRLASPKAARFLLKSMLSPGS